MTLPKINFDQHASLMRELFFVGATAEDLARAWASMDGKQSEFDSEKASGEIGECVYLGYMKDVEDMVTLAIKAIRARRQYQNLSEAP